MNGPRNIEDVATTGLTLAFGVAGLTVIFGHKGSAGVFDSIGNAVSNVVSASLGRGVVLTG